MKQWLATKRITAAVALVLLSGCSWFGGDDDESGPAPLADFELLVNVDRVWSKGVGGSADEYFSALRPVVADGVVYAASSDGDISAFQSTTGERLWEVELDIPISGGVGIAGDKVLVGNRKGQLFALNRENGVQLWQVSLSSEVLSPAAGNNKVVVAQVHDGSIVALNADTGEEIWNRSTQVPRLSLYGNSVPQVSDDAVVVATADGKLVSYDLERGAYNWEVPLANPRGASDLEKLSDIDGQILRVGEVFYVSGYQGSVAALSRTSGRVLWNKTLSSFHGPAVANNRLFVVEADDQLRCLRSNGGLDLWTNDQMMRRGLTAPVAFADIVVVADREGYMHVISAEDGQMVGRTKVDGSGVRAPMATDGTLIFVQDDGGDLSAYRITPK